MLEKTEPFERLAVIERRKAERVKSLLKAKIVFNNRMTSIDCIIKNISNSGARVSIDNTVSIANEFDLEIPLKGKSYRAFMKWRDRDSMGVEFIDGPAEVDNTPTHTRQLELENTRLRATVRALTKRLEDLGQDVQSLV